MREEKKEGFDTIETLLEEDLGGSDGQEREKNEKAEVRVSHPKRHRHRRNRARDVEMKVRGELWLLGILVSEIPVLYIADQFALGFQYSGQIWKMMWLSPTWTPGGSFRPIVLCHVSFDCH